jgi:hypothetical protein
MKWAVYSLELYKFRGKARNRYQRLHEYHEEGRNQPSLRICAVLSFHGAQRQNQNLKKSWRGRILSGLRIFNHSKIRRYLANVGSTTS